MTEYTDVPKVNALHMEQETVTSAIAMIDGGGMMSSFIISPPPPAPGAPMTTMVMAANISTGASPPSPETMAAIRDWLLQRSAEINTELESLGVTSTPDALYKEGKRS